MKNFIVFDFDGVLADSLESLYRVNFLSAQSLQKELSKKQYISGFEGSLNRRLASILELDQTQADVFTSKKTEIFPENYNTQTVQLFDFSKDLISNAGNQGELWILSTAPESHIRKLLDSVDSTKYFKKIIGQNKKPKSFFLEALVQHNPDSRVFFITDTTGDLQEAKKVIGAVHTIAVTWGFHTSELLMSETPDMLAQEPKDILEYIGTYV